MNQSSLVCKLAGTLDPQLQGSIGIELLVLEWLAEDNGDQEILGSISVVLLVEELGE